MKLDILKELNIANIKLSTSKPFMCDFCKTGFTKESTFMIHTCEQKRRHLAKDEKCVKLGFMAYSRFYELNQQNAKKRTHDDFVKSEFYNAFVKFGSFLNNVEPVYTNNFIDWMVTSGIKLNKWCDETLYHKYVLEYVKSESAETGLCRSINHMQAWAETKNDQWDNYFTNGSKNRIIRDILDGKMSPWLILNCSSGQQFLSQLLDEELQMVFRVLNPDYWMKQFKKYPNELSMVKEVIGETNL